MTVNHFSDHELACRCGCGLMPLQSTITFANIVREAWGHPLNCVSGARCQAYQNQLIASGISKATHSKHISGHAVDLSPTNEDYEAFHAFCVANLEYWGLYMEDPRYTRTWSHLQDVAPASNTRVFRP